MNTNLGIAGLPPGTDVIYRSPDASMEATRRAIATPVIAGMPVEVATRGPARQAGNLNEVFKAALSKSYDAPHGLEKSEPVVVEDKPEARKSVETERITGPSDVTRMIKAAQSNPSEIFDLQRGYSGREIAKIAKAAEPREVTSSTIERASLPLKRAIATFDTWVRDFNARQRRPGAARF